MSHTRAFERLSTPLGPSPLPSVNLETRYPYPGSGTLEDPYVIDWLEKDSDNPYNWTYLKKWTLTAQLSLGTFGVSLSSSVYSGGLQQVEKDLNVSHTVAVLPISLYVLGFGLGPLVFAPLSEIYGRRNVFIGSYLPFTLFQLGGALANNPETLLICRFFAGAFGSSPLTGAGAAISDIWTAEERTLPNSFYASGPWLGPVLGPLVGGLIAESTLRWRFIFWVIFVFSALVLLCGVVSMSETYAPVLLRRKAVQLQGECSGQLFFVSKFDVGQSRSFKDIMKVNMSRPFVFLFTEPIVASLAIYIALLYAALYSNFASYPIIFQQHRGWSPGQGGFAFLGIGVGLIFGNCLAPFQNKLYLKAMRDSPTGKAPPEVRLLPGILSSVLIPISMFWFAWTSDPSIHWMVPIAAGVPFGCGMLMMFLAVVQYLMDTYKHLCASAIAATVVLRSLLACGFAVSTPAMFRELGDQWGASVFAFLALGCMPLPLLFYIFGAQIRAKSKFACRLDDDSRSTPGRV